MSGAHAKRRRWGTFIAKPANCRSTWYSLIYKLVSSSCFGTYVSSFRSIRSFLYLLIEPCHPSHTQGMVLEVHFLRSPVFAQGMVRRYVCLVSLHCFRFFMVTKIQHSFIHVLELDQMLPHVVQQPFPTFEFDSQGSGATRDRPACICYSKELASELKGPLKQFVSPIHTSPK